MHAVESMHAVGSVEACQGSAPLEHPSDFPDILSDIQTEILSDIQTAAASEAAVPDPVGSCPPAPTASAATTTVLEIF